MSSRKEKRCNGNRRLDTHGAARFVVAVEELALLELGKNRRRRKEEERRCHVEHIDSLDAKETLGSGQLCEAAARRAASRPARIRRLVHDLRAEWSKRQGRSTLAG